MNKLEHAKDELVSKAMETAGKITNDQGLEFAGKFRQISTEIKGKTHEMRENVLENANDFIDAVRQEQQDK